MPGSESVVLGALQGMIRWGGLGLGAAVTCTAIGLIAGLIVLIRWLARRWRARSKALADQQDRALVALHHTLSQLRAEADTYPPDTPAPYGPRVERLLATLARIETDYVALHTGLAALHAEPLTRPDRPWARAVYWLWREPRHWWRQRRALIQMQQKLAGPRAEAEAAKSLLKELRGQPLETSKRVRTLYELVETSQLTVGALQSAGVCGTPIEAADAALRSYRKTLQALPFYLFACTDSQIMRRAQPTDIAESWGTAMALEPAIRQTAERTGAWQAAHDELTAQLACLEQAAERARSCLDEMPDAVDTTTLIESWRRTETEVAALKARYEKPTTEDLATREPMTAVIQEVDQFTERLTALQRQQAKLETALQQNQERLAQIEQHLRQLSEASRYPLDRVPFQVTVDQLQHQAHSIGGARDCVGGARDCVGGARDCVGGARDCVGGAQQQRAPGQLETALKAATALADRIQDLATDVTAAREQRRRLIECLDQQAQTAQVDWLTWARDLHQHTRRYAVANWGADNGSPPPQAADKAPASDAGLRVHAIVADAERLAEEHRRWVPARVDDPLAPRELDRRLQALTTLFAETERFQDRLDRITRRLQVCQETEEAAKSDLAAVYGALDHLDIVAANVLPPALAQEDNHWTQVREQLDKGYALELALGNPGLGTVDEKAAQVTRWIAAGREVLTDWRKVLDREIVTTKKALEQDLDDLMGIAPLEDEPAVAQAREAAAHKPPTLTRRARTASSDAADATAQAAREVTAQLRTLAHLDRALAALRSDVVEPLTQPVARWRDAEQQAGADYKALQRLETTSARLWPPVSCDTATVSAEFDEADRVRDRLYQSGATVAQVVTIVEALTDRYRQIIAMAAQREAAYQAQRTVLDATVEQTTRWCDRLARYRDDHADDDAVVAAIRARLDEIEAGWTQLQIRYDHAPDLIPGEAAQRALNDLWRQAHRDLPLGPGLDLLTADEVERG